MGVRAVREVIDSPNDDQATLEQARELCGGCVKAVVDATAQETP